MKVFGGFLAFAGFIVMFAAASTSDGDPSVSITKVALWGFAGLAMFGLGIYLNTRKSNGCE